MRPGPRRGFWRHQRPRGRRWRTALAALSLLACMSGFSLIRGEDDLTTATGAMARYWRDYRTASPGNVAACPQYQLPDGTAVYGYSLLLWNPVPSDDQDPYPPASLLVWWCENSNVGFGDVIKAAGVVPESVHDTEVAGVRLWVVASTEDSSDDQYVSLPVLEYRLPNITLTIAPERLAATEPTAVGTIHMERPLPEAVPFALRPSDTTLVTVPPAVPLPAGETSVSFPVAGVANASLDSDQAVIITAWPVRPMDRGFTFPVTVAAAPPSLSLAVSPRASWRPPAPVPRSGP